MHCSQSRKLNACGLKTEQIVGTDCFANIHWKGRRKENARNLFPSLNKQMILHRAHTIKQMVKAVSSDSTRRS